MENVRGDWFEDEKSAEERLAGAALRERVRMAGQIIGEEGYRDVGDYDPVLRSHCRLEPVESCEE